MWTGFLTKKSSGFFYSPFIAASNITIQILVLISVKIWIPSVPSLQQFETQQGNFFISSAHWFLMLFVLSRCSRWNRSVDEPSPCCHSCCSWPVEMCKAWSTPIWTCPGSVLRYSQAKHPAVQQFCIAVCLKPSSLPTQIMLHECRLLYYPCAEPHCHWHLQLPVWLKKTKKKNCLSWHYF